MANLIPTAAKRSIVIEYWVRVVSVWLVLIGVAALIIVVLNVPSYLLIQGQLNSFGNLYEEASQKQNSFDKIEADIIRANDTAAILASVRKYDPLVPFVIKIQSLADAGINISSYNLSRTGNKLETITITGVAADRQSLVSFSDSIEEAEEFLSADIPLSNLAKDSDIPFTIKIELSQTTS